MDRSVYGPYLLLLDPEQLAVIAMHCERWAIVGWLGGCSWRSSPRTVSAENQWERGNTPMLCSR